MRIAADHKRRLSVWSETLSLADLSLPATLRPLADRGFGLLAAVWPDRVDGLERLAQAAADHGVPLGVWPMLSDAQGRWLSAANAAPFAEFGSAILRRMATAGHLPSTLVLDLEPPLGRVRALIDGRAVGLRRPAKHSLAPLESLRSELARDAIETLAAVVPTVCTDPRGRPGWQRALGVPVDDVQADTVSAMLYSSLAVGYSRGVLRPEDGPALVHAFARATRQRFGKHSAVSLGAVGPGALGDEASLAGPDALRADAGAARAAGVHDLAVFELGAMLRRDPTEAWFDAVCDEAPLPPPPPRRRVRWLKTACRGLGFAFAAWPS